MKRGKCVHNCAGNLINATGVALIHIRDLFRLGNGSALRLAKDSISYNSYIFIFLPSAIKSTEFYRLLKEVEGMVPMGNGNANANYPIPKRVSSRQGPPKWTPPKPSRRRMPTQKCVKC
jgi:hypothetical protein